MAETAPSGPPAAKAVTSPALLPKIFGGLVLAVAVATGLTLFGDAGELGEALRTFNWWLLAPVLLLTVWNYGWRFVKWQLYLRRLNVGPIPTVTSALVFLAGFTMAITPGKVGELVKSVYLRRIAGAPVNRTSAIVAAERVTDGLAMLALAAVGLTQFAYGRTLVGVIAVCMLCGLLLLQRPGLFRTLLLKLENRALFNRGVPHGLAFLDASESLYQPPILSRAVGLGIVSWSGECVAFYLVLVGLGLDGNWELFLIATFVLAVSSLLGGVSMLPGGLGVTDASVAGMLLVLVDDEQMTRGVAAAATLIIRFATLWFAVLLGAVAMAILERSLRAGVVGGQVTVEPTASISETI